MLQLSPYEYHFLWMQEKQALLKLKYLFLLYKIKKGRVNHTRYSHTWFLQSFSISFFVVHLLIGFCSGFYFDLTIQKLGQKMSHCLMEQESHDLNILDIF